MTYTQEQIAELVELLRSPEAIMDDEVYFRAAAALEALAAERGVRPTGWIRSVKSYCPGEPDEWDVEFSYGDDQPDGGGWAPVYQRHLPAPPSPASIKEGRGE